MGANLKRLRKRIRAHNFFETKHMLEERAYRNITTEMIIEAIGYDDPEICEDYPDSFPWPSCLILGWTRDGMPLHVHVAYFQEQTRIVTAYAHPDPDIWHDDLCTRRQKQ
jgi:hypothetical protein